MFKDLFVSYGRRESLGFVGRLHRQLKLAGFDGWFDKVNIPDGEDYAARINHGIESAHNFAYVMAPRCLTSPYCLIELEYARILGKRLIPINQMVIFTTDDKALSIGDQQVLHGFYTHHGIADPNITTTQAVLDRSLALIGRTDWLDAKEIVTDADCNQLADWARQYENFWHHHDDLNYLHDHDLPIFGQPIDPLDGVVERITTVLQRHQTHVQQHTHWLNLALYWQRQQHATQHLLVGKDRTAAEQWLLTQFDSGEQPPCEPPPVLCEFICEARKNAENTMTQAFMCYDAQDKTIRDQIVHTLARQAITTWTHDRDIQIGTDYTRAIQQGIEQADNFLFLISPHSVQSEYCRQELVHALQYHKRIIPILITATPEALLPESLRGLQYLRLADDGITAILAQIQHDQTYFEQHKILLVRALQWLYAGKQPAFLLRGYNLEQAKTWWRLSERRQAHPPTPWHRALITASEAARGQLHTEVFISYSRKDSDFARKLNFALQSAGKTTWFDQESISSGVDFEAEIFNGIRSSDNFLFIISPDAVDSEYCEREVNFAAEQHKRFIPVRWRDTDLQQLPAILQRLQWLDFLTTPFEQAFLEIIQAIELDRDHARQHTILQQRAHDWEEYQRSPDFLLNKTACQKALAWLDTTAHKQPAPTELQHTFIQTSQQAIATAEAAEQQRRARELAIEQERHEALAAMLEQERQHAQRQRRLMFIVIFAFFLSLLAGGYAFEQKNRIEQQKVEIEQQKTAIETALQDAQRAKQIADQERQRAEQALVKAEAEEHKAKDQEQQAQTALAEAQQQRQRAEQQTQLTEQQKQIAETQTQKAQQQEQLAQQQAQLAQQAQRRAELNRHQAQQEAEHAQQQSDLAQAERQHAQQQSTLAQYQANRAQQQTTIAQQQKQLATQQSRLAQQQALTAQAQTVEADQQRQTAKKAATEAVQQQQSADTARIEAEKQTRLALEQKQRADEQTQIAQQQSWRNESLLFASQAEREIEKQHFLNAAVLALQGLPKPLDDSENHRPYVGQAGAALSQVIDKLPLHSRQLAGHESGVNSAAFSPDGQQVVTASSDGTVRVWDINNKEVIQVLVGHEDIVNYAVFSPDGQQVVTASSDGTARVWDINSGEVLQVLVGHDGPVRTATFSPDGQLVVTASLDNTARLWNINSGKIIQVLVGHDSYVLNAAFSPDGQRVVTTSYDKTARVWDVNSGEVIQMLVGHDSYVLDAAFSPDGQQIVTASYDKTARVWDVNSGEVIRVLSGHEDGITSATFSPNGQWVVTASYDKTARVWDVNSEKVIGVFAGHENWVNSATFSPDGQQVVTASDDKTARVWDVNSSSGEVLWILASSVLLDAAFSPNGQWVVTASDDNTAQVWDVNSGEVIQVLVGHGDGVNSAAFSPDGQRVVTASYDKTARIWDVNSGKVIQVLVGHDSYVLDAAFSPDGQQMVTASYDKTARVWDVNTRKVLWMLAGHEGPVYSAAFSPDGQQVVTTSDDGTARVWDVNTGKVLKVLAGHEGPVISAAFSPDGQQVVTASGDRTAQVWDINSCEVIQVLVGHGDGVTSAAFSSDSQRVVTASDDKTARVWDVNTGEVIQQLAGHEGLVSSAAFSPDGQRVVTASYDYTARVWPTPFANWQALVDSAWPRVWSVATTLQRQELLLYLLDIETAEWRKLKYLTQQIDYLRTQVLQLPLTPKQQQTWSFYLWSWLWQRLTWEDIEPTKRELFYQTVISALGEVWQVTPEKQRFWQELSPNYFNHLLLEKLELVWNNWPLEQQVPLLIQLAALPPR